MNTVKKRMAEDWEFAISVINGDAAHCRMGIEIRKREEQKNEKAGYCK